MDWFYSLYTAIEKTFFNTLSKKIAGNIGFLTVIFWFAMYFAYPDSGAASAWWTILIVGSGAFFFTIGYLIYLIKLFFVSNNDQNTINFKTKKLALYFQLNS